MPDADRPRLIEVAFPLKQASLDSVHEKNVRHGHISTLHIWPARRPLAACRAALIATLLPDPGTPEKRKELLEKIGGKVVTEVQKKKVGGKTVEVVILHRHDFGLEDAPVGACILYAVSCNLSDTDLTNRFEILLRTGGLAAAAAEDDGDEDAEDEEVADADADPEEGTGSTVKLRPWHQRKRKTLGYDAEGRPAPLIDQVHRLMHLWKAWDVVKVDDYLDSRGLRKNALFLQLLQALIERAGEGTDERVILENISNHLAARGVAPVRSHTLPGLGADSGEE